MGTELKIFTDGGCSGNPGPGGWAYVMVLQSSEGEKVTAQEKGSEKNTTNNRMELTAVISALRVIKTADLPPEARRFITLYTDSQYVQKGITSWIHTWKRNAWRTADKKPVKNKDLWEELDSLAGALSVKWEWIKGHAGNEYNEICDSMTQEAIASVK
ncbi:MAG: ribonuclease HI [Treponema sp.]|nr:ribonuclease HI [Treponema sp.]